MPGLLCSLGPEQLDTAGTTGPDRVARQLLKQLGPEAACMACTAYEILHALYEAIVDLEDLIEHVRGEVLNPRRMRILAAA